MDMSLSHQALPSKYPRELWTEQEGGAGEQMGGHYLGIDGLGLFKGHWRIGLNGERLS